MTEELEKWMDEHGETIEDYQAGEAESNRAENLRNKKTWELLSEYSGDFKLLLWLTGEDDPEKLRERIIDGIIELNLDLE